ELGGQGGVAAGDLPLAQQLGQHEVRVGVALTAGAQHVVGGLPYRIDVAQPAWARPARSGPAPVRPARALPACPGFGSVGPALLGAHDNRSPASMRAPRAQSVALMRLRPCACTSPKLSAAVAVPTSTRLRSTRNSPGGSAGSGWSTICTGAILRRSPRNSAQAPGSGVIARIIRSTATAGAVKSILASSTVTLGA